MTSILRVEVSQERNHNEAGAKQADIRLTRLRYIPLQESQILQHTYLVRVPTYLIRRPCRILGG
jgi:hypothetical protein